MMQLSLFGKNTKTAVKDGACAFTGHRALEDDFSARKLKREIRRVIERGAVTFYCGMAMGFDLIAAELVLAMKKKFPQLKLIACVPHYGQEKRYSAEDKARYANVLKEADQVVTLADGYYTGCMHERNRYMVDRADFLIAYCHSETGGTAYTVKYFIKQKGAENLIDVRKKR